MAILSNAQTSETDSARPIRHLWYYVAVAFVVSADVIALALLPRPWASLTTLLAMLLLALVSILARRYNAAPFRLRLRERPNAAAYSAYIVLLIVVVVGAFALDFTLTRHGNLPWLAWVAGVLVFLVTSGGWYVDRLPAASSITE
jgi:drug/metabolite transporter (DMT)-like permease